MLFHIAEAAAKEGGKEKAADIFKQAFQLAREIGDASWRLHLLSKIATAMIEEGLFDQALQSNNPEN